VLGRIAADAATGAAVAGTGGAAVGAAVGSLAGGVGALPGAVAGGTAAGIQGAKLGAAFAAYNLESGHAFNEYAALRDEWGAPIDVDIAANAAIMTGAINAGLEYFSLGLLTKTFSGAKHLLRQRVKDALGTAEGQRVLANFAKRYSAAVAGEGITEFLQETVTVINGEFAKLADDGSFTKQDFGTLMDNIFSEETWGRSLEAGKKGAQASIVFGGVGSTVSAVGEYKHNKRISEDEQARIDHIQQTIESSDIAGKSPETVREVVEDVVSKQETSVEIHMPAADVQEALKQAELDPDQIKELGIDPDQLDEAATAGQDITVPAADFITKMIGSEQYEALRPHMRLSSESNTQFEQEIEDVEKQTFIQNLKAEAEQNAEVFAEAQEIYETVEAQLIKTGRVNKTAAKLAAQIMPAWAAVQAAEQGKTALEIFQDSGFNVQGPYTAEQQRIAEGRPTEAVQEILSQEFSPGQDFSGVKIDQTGKMAVTGDRVTIRKDAQEVWDEQQDRRSQLTKLAECLRGR